LTKKPKSSEEETFKSVKPKSKAFNRTALPLSKDNRTSYEYSIECVFNTNSVASKIITLVRDHNPNKGNTELFHGILEDTPKELIEIVQAISRDMSNLLLEEERCKRVYSPCYVIGDIHGNLVSGQRCPLSVSSTDLSMQEDLLTLERSIWKQMPVVGANYLFLGDYVDRGRWGLECALYLMAFKILCPNKVTLLRGNHEVRALQAQYSYKRECYLKYGDVHGPRIWSLTNLIFDCLPICALVDDTIWCSHGGIPRSADIATLNQMPREMMNPERMSSAAWEILWSDPCAPHQFASFAETMSENAENPPGFIPNFRRGTAFLFNERGAADFLARNGLTHIIRAHEVANSGYTFNFSDNKCLTIFSTSHYCGNENEAACVLADNAKLRVIMLDTANNISATDPPL